MPSFAYEAIYHKVHVSVLKTIDRRRYQPPSLFGKQSSKENDEAFASRVFFEDAFLEKDQKNVLMGIDTPKILSNPKPTTFQHYLEQDEGKISFDKRGNINGLKTYNDKTLLRGNKLYWHKDGNDWIETNKENIEKHQTQYTKINPVRTGIIFSGIIRFENLSDVERDALLFALVLPESRCHKLGMGKPLGLGSVKITPRLFLSNRKTRYEELFAEWEQQIPESTAENKDISHFKKKFAEYILKGIGEDTGTCPVNTLWEVDRMKELKVMLDFVKKPADEKTRYMQIEPENEFKERRVLPLPTEVVQ